MQKTTMQTITSLASTYTYLDEDLIEGILVKEPDQADLLRAASALRLARRALGCSIIAPIELQFSNAENAAQTCEILKDHLGDLIDLSPASKASEKEVNLLHQYAIDIYTLAASIAFLLSKDKMIQMEPYGMAKASQLQ